MSVVMKIFQGEIDFCWKNKFIKNKGYLQYCNIVLINGNTMLKVPLCVVNMHGMQCLRPVKLAMH